MLSHSPDARRACPTEERKPDRFSCRDWGGRGDHRLANWRHKIPPGMFGACLARPRQRKKRLNSLLKSRSVSSTIRMVSSAHVPAVRCWSIRATAGLTSESPKETAPARGYMLRPPQELPMEGGLFRAGGIL